MNKRTHAKGATINIITKEQPRVLLRWGGKFVEVGYQVVILAMDVAKH